MNPCRRKFLVRAAQFAAATPLVNRAAAATAGKEQPAPRGKAEHCIFLWLGGGACHIDTWDPKKVGDAKRGKAGSYYPAIDTAISGVRLCQHLGRTAKVLDRCALLRTVQHDVINEHAAAVNRLHTGRPTADSIVYPSVGSVVAQQLGSDDAPVPAYVLIGYPNVTRGPGFLGAKYGYVYLTDTRTGPSGFSRPAGISAARQARREMLLAPERAEYKQRAGSRAVLEYDAALERALRLAGPEFMRVFDLASEKPLLRDEYGGEFGQRCLLARRLVQSGVRFVEVSHNLNFVNGTGWDTHNQGQLQQHVLIEELDRALAALVLDLERQRLLEKTLVVVATEFGRPAQFDGGGGRGHHAAAFSIVLAGGGLKTGQAVGHTDELGMKILSRPISVPDLHATMYATLGIDPSEELYAGERPVPITDRGQPVRELFG